jgi:hypothetical protein
MTRKRTWLAGVASAAGVAAIWLAIPQFVATAAPPAQKAPALQCTLTAAGTSDVGFTNDPMTTALAKVDIMPTAASCKDNRPDVESKITGATVKATEPGSLKGNCATLTAKATLEVTWVLNLPAAEPVTSTIEVEGGLKDGVPSGGAKVVSGALEGYTVSAFPANLDAADLTRGLLEEACKTEEGATKAALMLNVFFNAPPA